MSLWSRIANAISSLTRGESLSDVFEKLTKGVIKELENRNTILPPTEVIKMSNSVGCLTTKN